MIFASNPYFITCKSPLMYKPYDRQLCDASGPQRFGHSNGDSGWRWERNGVGMGGKAGGPSLLVIVIISDVIALTGNG